MFLIFSTDPNSWTSAHVRKWLSWATKAYRIDRSDAFNQLEQFSGSDLCSLSRYWISQSLVLSCEKSQIPIWHGWPLYLIHRRDMEQMCENLYDAEILFKDLSWRQDPQAPISPLSSSVAGAHRMLSTASAPDISATTQSPAPSNVSISSPPPTSPSTSVQSSQSSLHRSKRSKKSSQQPSGSNIQDVILEPHQGRANPKNRVQSAAFHASFPFWKFGNLSFIMAFKIAALGSFCCLWTPYGLLITMR